MIRHVTVKALECTCEAPDCPRHGKPWISVAKRPPVACSTCKSREWNGVKRRRKPSPAVRIELPKPKKVRIQE